MSDEIEIQLEESKYADLFDNPKFSVQRKFSPDSPYRVNKNWVAQLNKNGFKSYLSEKNDLINVGHLSQGDLIEIGANYVRGSGREIPAKDYALVKHRDRKSLILKKVEKGKLDRVS